MSVSDSITNFAQELQSLKSPEGRNINLRLGNALGWSGERAHIDLNGEQFQMFHSGKGLLGNQPALLFVSGNHAITNEIISLSALFAYHSAIQWGVISNTEKAFVFNSHWLRKGDWFVLPPLEWVNPGENIEMLEAITPNGVLAGEIERTATKYFEPDKLLLPVDEALVERLDYWRDEAIKFTNQEEGIDKKLQILFAQLFVIRAIEDRNLSRDIPKLENTLNKYHEADFDNLQAILEKAKTQIQSELFDQNVFSDFPRKVVGGIIKDLYVPYNLPHGENRYNFEWLSSDVLGQAYEKYLSNILVPIPYSSPQLHLFEQPVRDVERISVRKKAGIFYTPHFLVNFLTERGLDHFYSNEKNKSKIPTLGDFSCGSGSFLTHAVDSLINRLRQEDPNRNWGKEIIKKKKIIGIDNDQRAVVLARLSLWLRLAEEPKPLPLPALEDVIIFGDSLSRKQFKSIPKVFDVVMGNPPFIATGKIEKRHELAKKYKTAVGRFDYSSLFVELAISRLRGGGILTMVVPNRLFQNKSAKSVRKYIIENAELLTALDFGSNEVFSETSAYIGAIIARKVNTARKENQVKVINIKELAKRFMSLKMIEADLETEEYFDRYLEAFLIQHPTSSDAWLFVPPSIQRERIHLEEISEPLSGMAGIYQGIKTGANDIFIVRIVESSVRKLVKIQNGLGEEFILEEDLLEQVVFGADINKFTEVQSENFLIYPYINNGPLSRAELMSKYPYTYSYFEYYEKILSKRRSLVGSGLKWYELIRKRDSNWLKAKKLLIRDLALEPSFGIDREGNYFLIGGTAIVPSDSDWLLPLLGYLNSSVIKRYLSHQTSSYRAGFQKYEPKHLQNLPIPKGVIHNHWEEIAQLVEEIVNENTFTGGMPSPELEESINSLLEQELFN